MKKKFMETHLLEFPVDRMAKVLEFSRSGFYKRKNRKPGIRDKEDEMYLGLIRSIHQEFRRPGVLKTWEEMRLRMYRIGKDRVHKIMKNNGIHGKIRRKSRVQTTDSSHKFPVSPDLLKRNFKPEKRNEIWVSDITYIRTASRFLYLCIVMDLYSRKIVGWSMKDSLETGICISALRMAVRGRSPDKGLIFHSDRGVQYASREFRKELRTYGMLQSMSRKGNCWDNAVAESFFSILKTEMDFNVFLNSGEARKYIFDFIEAFYNRKRTHSFLGYRSPDQFEKITVA